MLTTIPSAVNNLNTYKGIANTYNHEGNLASINSLLEYN